MSKLLASAAFAAVYAVGSQWAHRVTVLTFDLWDPRLGDQAGNVAVLAQALPVFVGCATLSFLGGMAVSSYADVDGRRAVAGGAIAGGVASLLLFAEPVLRQLGELRGLPGLLGGVLFWTGPGLAAAATFRLWPRRSRGTWREAKADR